MATKTNPSDLADAISATADNAEPDEDESAELAEAQQHLTAAATALRKGDTPTAKTELEAARDLIEDEVADGDADMGKWNPLLKQLQQHLTDLGNVDTGKTMDAAIRNRARR